MYKKQQEILDFINQNEKEGYSPSVREIASAVGLKLQVQFNIISITSFLKVC